MQKWNKLCADTSSITIIVILPRENLQNIAACDLQLTPKKAGNKMCSALLLHSFVIFVIVVFVISYLSSGDIWLLFHYVTFFCYCFSIKDVVLTVINFLSDAALTCSAFVCCSMRIIYSKVALRMSHEWLFSGWAILSIFGGNSLLSGFLYEICYLFADVYFVRIDQTQKTSFPKIIHTKT